MGERAVASPMTVEEYYAWCEHQDERYEFVDGYPIRMMTGASRRHDQIAVNVLVALGSQLRGSKCRPFTSDTAVMTGPERRRRPDAGVECGERRDADFVANEPRLVVEILSPSTREFNLYAKLDEYKLVHSMSYILLAEPNAPEVILWTRRERGDWSVEVLEGLDSIVDLPIISVRFSLADLYESVTFRPTPRLVDEG